MAIAAALLCLSAGLAAAGPLPGLSVGGFSLVPGASALAPQGSTPLKLTLHGDQQEDLSRALRWTWLSVTACGLDPVSGAVALTVDPLMGGILGLGSLVFWGISTWNMAKGLGAVESDLNLLDSDAPRPMLQEITSFIAAACAVTFAISLGYAFADDTGVAHVFMGVSVVVTSIGGGIAVSSTFIYTGSVDRGGEREARAGPPLVPVARKRRRHFYPPLLRFSY